MAEEDNPLDDTEREIGPRVRPRYKLSIEKYRCIKGCVDE
jgi:hypothetical protein